MSDDTIFQKRVGDDPPHIVDEGPYSDRQLFAVSTRSFSFVLPLRDPEEIDRGRSWVRREEGEYRLSQTDRSQDREVVKGRTMELFPFTCCLKYGDHTLILQQLRWFKL